jgi:hypothetical protein
MTFAVGGEVPRRRLLDVEDAREAARRALADLPQAIEDVAHVRTALVEVETVLPVRDPSPRLHLRRDAVDAQGPLDVPPQVLAAELDLDPDDAVVVDPFGQGLGQAVADGLLDVARLERIEPADAVEEGDALGRPLEQESVQPVAAELGTQVARQVGPKKVGPVTGVGAAPVNLAERVVDRGVERARDDERAELRDRLIERELT